MKPVRRPGETLARPKPALPDTNTILRYLLDDEPQLAVRARDFWEPVREGSSRAILTEGVLMECVYVLQRFYKAPRERIASSLSAILGYKGLEREGLELFEAALDTYGVTSLDFVDCLLVAREEAGLGKVFSFDDKLNAQITRKERR
jgi:predicted nucleic-acid-binding protein